MEEILFEENIDHNANIYYELLKCTAKDKRKFYVSYFIVVTIVCLSCFLLDILGPKNFHTLEAGFFFLPFVLVSIFALYKNSNYYCKKISKNYSFLAKSSYQFYSTEFHAKTTSDQFITNIIYKYDYIKKVYIANQNLAFLLLKDNRYVPITANNVEDILEKINVK